MNPKNQLQELCQKRGFPIPKYTLVDRSGPSHLPVVTVSVTVEWNGEILEEVASEKGSKQKDVEKKAAEKMYERITKMLSDRDVSSTLVRIACS